MKKFINSINRHAVVAIRSPRKLLGAAQHRIFTISRRLVFRQTVILFERHGGIGDIICTFPSVLALRERHPKAIFVYSVRRAFKCIVKMGHVADCIVEQDWSTESPKVVTTDYDTCYRPWLEDEKPTGREHVHLVDDFARGLNVTLRSRQPRLYPPAKLTRLVQEKLSPLRKNSKILIGIHIGPSWTVREWRTEAWQQLVNLLKQSYNCTIVQFGADVDTTKGAVRAPRIERTEDFVGKLSLEESVAALQQLDFFIGIDSGLLHIAGSVGTPTVGLFGAIDPQLRLPPGTLSEAVMSSVPCLGCHHRTPVLHSQDQCVNRIVCMSELNANDVLVAFEKLRSRAGSIRETTRENENQIRNNS